MKKFKVECSWTEYHSRELIVEADNKNEAIELLKLDQNRLLEFLIDKYANETFSYLSDISVVEKRDKMEENVDFVIKDTNIIYMVNYFKK